MRLTQFRRFGLVAMLTWPFLFCVRTANAQNQDLEAGLVPYQSFHWGDIDAVNLSNGKLAVKIPLISYPQRGGKLKLDFTMNYNLIVSAAKHTSGNQTFWGWTYGDTLGSQNFSLVDDQQVGTNSTQTQEFQGIIVCQYAVMESDGAVHPVAYPDNRTIDATGFYVTIPSQGQCGTGPVIDRKGITYSPGGNVLRQDPNGNQILQNSNGFLYVDSAGRGIAPSTNTTDFTGCSGSLPTTSATDPKPEN